MECEWEFEFLVGQSFFIKADKRKQAPIASAFQSEEMVVDEARNRNDAATRPQPSRTMARILLAHYLRGS